MRLIASRRRRNRQCNAATPWVVFINTSWDGLLQDNAQRSRRSGQPSSSPSAFSTHVGVMVPARNRFSPETSYLRRAHSHGRHQKLLSACTSSANLDTDSSLAQPRIRVCGIRIFWLEESVKNVLHCDPTGGHRCYFHFVVASGAMAQGPAPETAPPLFPGGGLLSYNSIFTTRGPMQGLSGIIPPTARPTFAHEGDFNFTWGFHHDFDLTILVPDSHE